MNQNRAVATNRRKKVRRVVISAHMIPFCWYIPVPSSWEKKESEISEPETKIIIRIADATGSGFIVKWGTLPLGDRLMVRS